MTGGRGFRYAGLIHFRYFLIADPLQPRFLV